MPFGPLSRLEARRPARRGAAPVRGRAAWRSSALDRRCFAFYWRGPWLAPFGIGARRLARSSARSPRWAYAREAVRSRRRTRVWRRARGLPRSAYGTTLAHAGIGLAVIGIVATTAWRARAILAHEARRHAPRSPATTLAFQRRRARQGPELPASRSALFDGDARRRAGHGARAREAHFDAPRKATTEAGIHVALARRSLRRAGRSS